MSDVLNISPLGSRWQTADPFLFCVHHIDHYPKGNDRLGPAASLAGHDMGQDFNNPPAGACITATSSPASHSIRIVDSKQ